MVVNILLLTDETPPDAIVSLVVYTYITAPAFILVYQLAFFTPGRFPASAFWRNWYCKDCQPLVPNFGLHDTHTPKPEVAEDTTSLSSYYTSVLDLCEPCVAVHLRKLELSLCAHTLRECRVADYVSKCLPVMAFVSRRSSSRGVRAHTVRARFARTPCASCGRECYGHWQNSRCRALRRGIET
jgi:hypothetical protein